MWAHLLSAYFFGAIVLYEVEGVCRRYERFRRRYLAMPRPRNFAVLVRDLPTEFNEEETIRKHFESIQGAVHGLARVRKLNDLETCSKKRQKALRHLGRAEYAREEQSSPKGVEPEAAYAVGASPTNPSERGPLLKRMCCRSQKKLAASQSSYEELVEKLNAQVWHGARVRKGAVGPCAMRLENSSKPTKDKRAVPNLHLYIPAHGSAIAPWLCSLPSSRPSPMPSPSLRTPPLLCFAPCPRPLLRWRYVAVVLTPCL